MDRKQKPMIRNLALIVMTIMLLTALFAVTFICADAASYYTLRVEYLYADGCDAHDAYVAVYSAGEDVDLTVTNPIIPGYKPYTAVEGGQEALTTQLTYPKIGANHTITVYYIPDLVHYKVRYFKQNIRDDLYTEDLGLDTDQYERTGYTGSYPIYLENIEFEGFVSLFHDPDSIASDGSTVFKLYFDRKYSLLSFDLDGGTGVEPVYAKYGTAFNIPEPTKEGYSFLGWATVNENDEYINADGDVISEEEALANVQKFTSGTVPAEDVSYKAMWKPETASYSIVYWIENPNSKLDEHSFDGLSYEESQALITENFSVIAAKDIKGVTSGSSLSYDYITENYDFFNNYTDYKTEFPTMSDAEISELDGQHKKYYKLNELLTHMKFDNSSDDHTITVAGDNTTRVNMYYDRKTFSLQFYYAREKTDTSGNTLYYLTSGTKQFSRSNNTDPIEKVKDAGWGRNVVSELPQIADKYEGILIPQYKTDKNGSKYWYYEIKTKYGADMHDIWHNDAFKPLQKYTDKTNATVMEEGQTVHFGSWAVENGTKYKEMNDNTPGRNYTVKGLFEKLDAKLMYTDSWLSSHTNTDYTELHYVASWTNTDVTTGKDFNCGVKRVFNFTYKCYIDLLPYEKEIVDNSESVEAGFAQLIDMGNYIDIIENNGTYYGLKAENKIETYDSGNQYIGTAQGGDLDKAYHGSRAYAIYKNQTPIDLYGCVLLSDSEVEQMDEQSGTYNPQSTWYAANGFDADHHADVLFFYHRKEFTLKYRNDNQLESGHTVKAMYDAPLNQEKFKYTPEYPHEALKDYFEFAGWYYDPFHLQPVDFSTARMPGDDETLYAKWVPVIEDVTFYNDYKQYSRGNAIHSCRVTYNDKIDDGSGTYTLTKPSKNARFAGWYYINDQKKPVRFDPENMTVTRKLDLYATWESTDTAKYKVNYVEKGTDIEVAPPSTGTVFVSKTKTFTAKSGNEFNEAHKWTEDGANWWPTVSSHSVLVEENEYGKEFEPNVYNFEYIQKRSVWYQVQYINAVTGAPMELTESGEAYCVIDETNNAVVSAKSKFYKDYIADRVTKSIILSASVNEDPEKAKEEELSANTIIFYYNPNAEEALYQVDHMIQSVENPDEYTLYHSETLSGVIGDTVTFEHLYTDEITASLKTSGYFVNEAKTTVNDTAAEGVSFTIDQDMKIIKIFYDRLRYSYVVKYVDYEAERRYESENDPSLWNGIMYTKQYNPVSVGEDVEINPPHEYEYQHVCPVENTLIIHTYHRISDRQLTLTIRPDDNDDPKINVMKVYYRKNSQRILNYEIVCTSETEDDFAYVSQSREIVEYEDEITGCTVYKNPDFEEKYIFRGWYNTPTPDIEPIETKGRGSKGSRDSADTEIVTDSETIVPEFPGADVTFYAVFDMKKVSAQVDVMYNKTGVYDTKAKTDTDGSVTGYTVFFDNPHEYISETKTPYEGDGSFVFELTPVDERLYKYEFAGWYSIDPDGTAHERLDQTSKTVTEPMVEDHHYVAMFKERSVTSLNYEIRYRFNTRLCGTQDYVIKKTLESDDLKAATAEDSNVYELNNDFILKNAPYESNYGEKLVWSSSNAEKTSSAKSNTLYAVVIAVQEQKKVAATFRTTPDGVYETITTFYGANHKLDHQMLKISAPETYKGYKFSCWEVRKSADDKAPVIAKSYTPLFDLCMMDNYCLSPVYLEKIDEEETADDPDTKSADDTKGETVDPTEKPDDAPTEAAAEAPEQADPTVILSHLGYSRNRWTDDDGNIASTGETDHLFTDFEISFEDNGSKIYNSEDYKTGVVFELCARVPDNFEFDQNKDYNATTDFNNLGSALIDNVVNGKSVNKYSYASGKNRSIQICDIPTGDLTDHNRVEFGKLFYNAFKTDADGNPVYTNSTYLLKATAYLIKGDKVTFSNSVYVCFKDIASMNAAVEVGDMIESGD